MRTTVVRTLLVAFIAFVVIPLSLGLLTAQTFRVTSINTTNNDVRISWDAPGGSNYVVQTATNLADSNFADVSPVIYVPVAGNASTGYTHFGGTSNSSSRFYRVKASAAPPVLKIVPTNAIIGLNTTNRYSVLLVYPDNSSQDVTASATLTVSNKIGSALGLSSDGFALVRGTNLGTGSVRAVYQGQTNTVALTVAQLTGLYTIPPLSQLNAYAYDQTPSIQVMGIFSNKTNNITPSTVLSGGAVGVTRMDYRVSADVANSYALITGQSAANGDIELTAGAIQGAPISVTWCVSTNPFYFLEYVALQPTLPQIRVGQSQQFSVNLPSARIVSFVSSDETVATADPNTLSVTGLSAGSVTIYVSALNSEGCASLSDFTWLTITNGPPVITNQPTDQIAPLGGNTTFTISAGATSPLFYQWQFSGANLAGQTNSSLTISNVGSVNQGDYRVVVTNSSGSVTSSTASLKVVPAGIVLWTNLYKPPGNTYVMASAITLDNLGNPVATGYFVVNSTNQDWVTIKYSGAGVPLWTNRYNGPANSYDNAKALAADSSGNIFVTGSIQVAGYNKNWITIKYSGAGVPLWTNRYIGPTNSFISSYDVPKAIAVDSAGSVVVTGSGGFAGDDWVTLKYSSAGALVWSNRYDGPLSGTDFPNAVAIDAAGSAIVTGYAEIYSPIGGANYDFATIKYSSAGVSLWTNMYRGVQSIAYAIGVDNASNAYVTGSSASSLVGDYDCATIKYSSVGVPMWTNRYNGPINGNDGAAAMAVASQGNVYVTGSSAESDSINDFVTLAYTNTGVPLWTNRFNLGGAGGNQANAMVADANGNVFVTGYSPSATNNIFEWTTIKYSPLGEVLWISQFTGVDSYPVAAAVDSSGNLFVVGVDNDNEIITFKYSSAASP